MNVSSEGLRLLHHGREYKMRLLLGGAHLGDGGVRKRVGWPMVHGALASRSPGGFLCKGDQLVKFHVLDAGVASCHDAALLEIVLSALPKGGVFKGGDNWGYLLFLLLCLLNRENSRIGLRLVVSRAQVSLQCFATVGDPRCFNGRALVTLSWRGRRAVREGNLSFSLS